MAAKRDKFDYKVHPAAAMYPPCSPEEDESLYQSIRAVGVTHALTVWDDDQGRTWLVDGLNRAKIVSRLHAEGIAEAENGEPIELRFVKLETTVPSQVIAFIEGNNIARRGLSSSQKAAVGVRSYIRYRKAISDETGVPAEAVDADAGDIGNRIASRYGTNRQYVYDCVMLHEAARGQDLLDQVVAGKLKITRAKAILRRREAGLPDEPEDDADPAGAPVGPTGQEEPMFDGLKNPVHPDHRAVFAARETVAQIVKVLKKAKADAKALCEKSGGHNIVLDALETDFGNLTRNLNSHQPHAVCPFCAGTGKAEAGSRKKCQQCAGATFLDASQWKLVPDDVRAPFEKKDDE